MYNYVAYKIKSEQTIPIINKKDVEKYFSYFEKSHPVTKYLNENRIQSGVVDRHDVVPSDLPFLAIIFRIYRVCAKL